MKKILLILALGFFGLIASPSDAATWYIDAQNGVNSSICTISNPCASLQQALALAVGGDTIYTKGTFTGAEANILISSTFSGSVSQSSVITNWPGEANAIFDATGYNQAFIINGASYVDLKNITVTGANAFAIQVSNASRYVTLANNIIYNNTGSGVRLSNVEYVYLINNIIHGNAGSVGVDTGAAGYLYFINNTFHANNSVNNGYGIQFNGGDNFVILNNIFTQHTNYGINFTSSLPATLTANYNNYYNNSSAPIGTPGMENLLVQWQSLGHDLNSKEIDPEYVSTIAGSEDFHISATSGLINAGTDAAAYTTIDYDGEARYGTYDIGADEAPNPSAPSALTQADATLSWTAPATNITGYNLQLSTASDYSGATSVTLTTASQTLTELTANTTYHWRVNSYYTTSRATYVSDWATSSFTTNSDAPTALIAGDQTKNKIALTWAAPSGTIASYSLVSATDELFTENVSTLDGLTTNRQTVTGLTVNKKYYFKVAAYNGSNWSDYSEVLSTRTLPKKVSGVLVKKKFIRAEQVKVSWEKAGNNLRYRVKLMTKKEKKIKIYAEKDLNRVIKKLDPNKTYKVSVRAAFNNQYFGNWSENVKFTTLAE